MPAQSGTSRAATASRMESGAAGGGAGAFGTSAGGGVLRVNGETLTADELLGPFDSQLAAAGSQATREEFNAFLQQWVPEQLALRVREMLLYQEASKLLTDQVNPAVEQAVDQDIKDRVNREYGGRQSRFEEAIVAAGSSLPEYRERLRRQIVVGHYLQETLKPQISDPTRQELLAFYERQLQQYTEPGSRELYIIEIGKERGAAEARQAIDAAHAKLRAGEPFDAVARTYSTGLHAEDGGHWGTVRSALQGRYAPLSRTFFELQAHAFSGVIETGDAFFIVGTGEVQADRRESFTAVQPKLVEHYREARYHELRERLINDLYAKALIHPLEDEFVGEIVARAMQKHSRAARLSGETKARF